MRKKKKKKDIVAIQESHITTDEEAEQWELTLEGGTVYISWFSTKETITSDSAVTHCGGVEGWGRGWCEGKKEEGKENNEELIVVLAKE